MPDNRTLQILRLRDKNGAIAHRILCSNCPGGFNRADPWYWGIEDIEIVGRDVVGACDACGWSNTENPPTDKNKDC